MALNEKEKAACRYYLGYPGLSNSASISLGVPDKSQLNFILETNMNNLLPEHEPRVRRAIQELECIEDQTSKMRPGLELRAVVGSVQFAGGAGIDDVWEEYVRWVNALADTLGSPPNPFSDRLRRLGYVTGQVIEPC